MNQSVYAGISYLKFVEIASGRTNMAICADCSQVSVTKDSSALDLEGIVTSRWLFTILFNVG